LGRVERKNGWQLAEALGEGGPQGMQRLLNSADWDAEAVRNDLRAYVVEHLADEPSGVLVIDETGFLKKGPKSAGVARQYSGTAGRRENQQIGVFLLYASARGAGFVDRALYLPDEWMGDATRRAEVHIPAQVGFATKGELARDLLARAFTAGVPARWVVGDTIYSGDEVRRWLQGQGRSYVLAVPSTHGIWTRAHQLSVEQLVDQLPVDAWVRLSAGEGSQGPRWYDWACLRLSYATATGKGQWLLARRSVSDPTELAYYRVFGPEDTPVGEMVRVAGRRWPIEEGFEQAKGEVGLDQYEVRRYDAWHRHVTLALLAHAYLEVSRLTAVDALPPPGGGQQGPEGQGGDRISTDQSSSP
jgi:SRSO17 transposase